MLHRSVVLGLALALLGCGKDSGGGGGGGGDSGKVASCNMPTMQSCREYRGANLMAGEDNLAKLCTAVIKTATFDKVPCPADKRIGACKKPEGTDVYYEGWSEPADKLEKSCKDSGGTFTAK